MKCRLCVDDALDRSLVAGKVVYCDGSSRGEAALSAEAAGSIIPDQFNEGRTFPFPVPTSCLGTSNTIKILQYMNSARYFSGLLKKKIK